MNKIYLPQVPVFQGQFPHMSNSYRRAFNETAENVGSNVRMGQYGLPEDFLPKQGGVGRGSVSLLWDEAHKIAKLTEASRRQAVSSALSGVKPLYCTANTTALSEAELKAAKILAEQVGPIIDRLAFCQNHGFFPETHLFSDLDSQRTFEIKDANQTLDGSGGVFGNLFSKFPDQRSGMYGDGVDIELAQNSGDPAVTHPTNIVEMNGGKLVGVPFPMHPRFQKDCRLLAKILREIAQLNLNLPTKKILIYWASYFETGSVEAEKKAIQAMIDQGNAGPESSRLIIFLGPVDNYGNKLQMGLVVGVRSGFQSAQSIDMTQTWHALEAVCENKFYKARKNPPRGGSGIFMDVLASAGFFKGGYIGWSSDNGYPAGFVEGSALLMFSNYLAQIGEEELLIAKELFPEEFNRCQWRNEDLVHYVSLHELTHSIGPRKGDRVGKDRKDLGAAMGPYFDAIEELKAISGPGWILQKAYREGLIDRRSYNAVALNFLVYCTGKNLYEGKNVWLYGKPRLNQRWAEEVAFSDYYRTGGIVLKGNGRLQFNYDRIVDAAAQRFKKVVHWQASGNREAMLRFARTTVRNLPDRVDKRVMDAKSVYVSAKKSYFVPDNSWQQNITL